MSKWGLDGRVDVKGRPPPPDPPFALILLAELPYKLFSAEGQQCLRTSRRGGEVGGDNEGNFMMTAMGLVLATILGREGHPLATVRRRGH